MSAIRKVGISFFVVVLRTSCATASRSGTSRSATSLSNGKHLSLDEIAKSPTRKLEEVQLAFDRHKERFFTLVAAHFQRQPSSGGKIVLSITVESDGTISECHLVSSTLADTTLEEAVVSETKRLNVGERAVPAATFPSYPIHVFAR